MWMIDPNDTAMALCTCTCVHRGPMQPGAVYHIAVPGTEECLRTS